MIALPPFMTRLPAAESPVLSADVFAIRGDRRTYLFDVGQSDEACQWIAELPGEKAAVLSHFHPDHTGNISRISCAEVYVGGFTQKKIGQGIVVQEELCIHDGVKLVIRHCPSPHAKGSLILTVNGEYTLLGDLWYHRPDYDREAARQMLLTLRRIETKYFVMSHQENGVYERDVLLHDLEEHFHA